MFDNSEPWHVQWGWFDKILSKFFALKIDFQLYLDKLWIVDNTKKCFELDVTALSDEKKGTIASSKAWIIDSYSKYQFKT